MFSCSRFVLYVAAVALGATALGQTGLALTGAGPAYPPRVGITPETIPNNVISACVNKTTGVPRLVASTTVCLATEVFTQWNVKGVPGAVGATGAKGETGLTGATGPRGIQGLPGPTGPKGATGVAGATGSTGPRGVAGLTGAAGPKGATGATGPQGLTGPKGTTGPIGTPGSIGPKGPAGPQGLQGPKGDQGAPGTVNPLPANITTLSNGLGTNGYSGGTFQYAQTCIIGDIILSVNSYGAGAALPADGRLIQINQNTALFSLLGTRFGGDGQSTFALPDLRPFAPQELQYSICVQGIFPARN